MFAAVKCYSPDLMFEDRKVRTDLNKLTRDLRSATGLDDKRKRDDLLVKIAHAADVFVKKHWDALRRQVNPVRLFGAPFADQCNIDRLHVCHDWDEDPRVPPDAKLHEDAQKMSDRCIQKAKDNHAHVKKDHAELHKKVERMNRLEGPLYMARMMRAFVNRLPGAIKNSSVADKVMVLIMGMCAAFARALATLPAPPQAAPLRYAGGMVAAVTQPYGVRQAFSDIFTWIGRTSGEAAVSWTVGLWKGVVGGLYERLTPQVIQEYSGWFISAAIIAGVVAGMRHQAHKKRFGRLARGEPMRLERAKKQFWLEHPELSGIDAYLATCKDVVIKLGAELTRLKEEEKTMRDSRPILLLQQARANKEHDKETTRLSRLKKQWDKVVGSNKGPPTYKWGETALEITDKLTRINKALLEEIPAEITAIQTDMKYIQQMAQSAVDEKKRLLENNEVYKDVEKKDTTRYREILKEMIEKDRRRMDLIKKVVSKSTITVVEQTAQLAKLQLQAATVVGNAAFKAVTGV